MTEQFSNASRLGESQVGLPLTRVKLGRNYDFDFNHIQDIDSMTSFKFSYVECCQSILSGMVSRTPRKLEIREIVIADSSKLQQIGNCVIKLWKYSI